MVPGVLCHHVVLFFLGGLALPLHPVVLYIVQGVNISGWGKFKPPLHLVRGCQFCLLHLGDLLDPEDRQTDRRTDRQIDIFKERKQ